MATIKNVMNKIASGVNKVWNNLKKNLDFVIAFVIGL